MNSYIKITRQQAMYMYNACKTVILCPSKLRPGSPWHPECQINYQVENTFEQVENTFRAYNCTNETGGISYYVDARYLHATIYVGKRGGRFVERPTEKGDIKNVYLTDKNDHLFYPEL